MLKSICAAAAVASFALVAIPVAAPDLGFRGWSAQAAITGKKFHRVRAMVKDKSTGHSSWQYVLVPTSSGPAGAWR